MKFEADYPQVTLLSKLMEKIETDNLILSSIYNYFFNLEKFKQDLIYNY